MASTATIYDKNGVQLAQVTSNKSFLTGIMDDLKDKLVAESDYLFTDWASVQISITKDRLVSPAKKIGGK